MCGVRTGALLAPLLFATAWLQSSVVSHPEYEHGSDKPPVVITEKPNFLAAAGAWGSLGLMVALGALASEKLGEEAIGYCMGRIPGLASFKKGVVPSVLSWAAVIPSSISLYAKYYDFFWYFFYVLYSGTRVSLALAVGIIDNLGLLLKHLSVLLTVREQLIKYLQQVAAAAGDGGREVESLTKELVGLIDKAIAHGNAYVRSVYQMLHGLGVPVNVVGVPASSDQDIFIKMRGCKEAIMRETTLPLNGVDVNVLDRLARDLIAYWESYLSGLITTIDREISVCQRVFAAEQFVSTWLNRPLLAPEMTVVQPLAQQSLAQQSLAQQSLVQPERFFAVAGPDGLTLEV